MQLAIVQKIGITPVALMATNEFLFLNFVLVALFSATTSVHACKGQSSTRMVEAKVKGRWLELTIENTGKTPVVFSGEMQSDNRFRVGPTSVNVEYKLDSGVYNEMPPALGVFFETLGRLSLETGKTARMIVFVPSFTEHFREYKVRVEDMSRKCTAPQEIIIDPSADTSKI
jgi:hypothetical protein